MVVWVVSTDGASADQIEADDELAIERVAVTNLCGPPCAPRGVEDMQPASPTGLDLSEEGPRETSAEVGDEDIEAAPSVVGTPPARAVLAFKARELERAGMPMRSAASPTATRPTTSGG